MNALRALFLVSPMLWAFPDGNTIAGFVWSVPLQFHLDPAVPADAAGPYVAIPADLVINIDDISFTPRPAPGFCFAGRPAEV